MMSRRLLKNITSAFTIATLLWSGHATAMCFRTSDLQRPWNDGTYIYQFDASANNSVLSCGLAQNLTQAELAEYINPQTQQYYTIRELFLEGLDDWLNNQDFPVGLTPSEYTGVEPERVVVTSFCNESNHHKVETVQGYGTVRHLNLRPTTHTKTRFDRAVRHETGHSFGMVHMHQRWDRGDHVTIHLNNIPASDQADYNLVYSVSQCNGVNLMLPYDISSIMHYIPPLGPTCSTVESSGCTISPGSPHAQDPDYNPNYAADFNTIQGAIEISILDRRAMQYYYPLQAPDRVGVFNPEARLWSFVRMNQGILAASNSSAQISSYDPDLPGNYRAIYGDGMAGAMPLVGPWDEGALDRLGEGYLGGRSGPFWFHGDENANGDASDDSYGSLDVDLSAQLVTVDTNSGIQLVGYIPGDDVALTDLDLDGIPDNANPPSVCGLYSPGSGDKAFSGDFNGDGKRTLAVREASTGMVYIDLDGDLHFDTWTQPWLINTPVRPFAGDWNGNGRDEIGMYDPSTRMFYLDRDGTGGLEFYEGVSADLVFQFENSTPQPSDPLLWPLAGQFDAATVRTDIKNTSPWSLPKCELMSDGIVHCMEAWEWCVDVGEASNSCFPGVVCGEYIGVSYPDHEWPAGCVWTDINNVYQLYCELNPDCTPA